MRVKELEDAFYDRYNRRVTIDRTMVVQDNLIKTCTITITHELKTLVITEYLTDGQMTECAQVTYNGVTHSFKTHLEAEVYVADMIGAK
jgi:hypothetical protein